MCEEENVKQCGYLQHKGKQRLISMWRRWYCVLNGRLLLFYRSESDYCNLGKFHERLDLGLVYDVLPALGVENGIQISTHTGPHWLRTTDEKCYQLWLESLQASIVLRRQGSTIIKSKTGSSAIMKKVSSPVLNRHQKSKSTINDPWLTTDESESGEKKTTNPLSRFSLSFIPGHGKKYSTYDGNRLFRAEQSTHDEWDEKAKTDDDKKNAGVAKLRKKPFKEPRPLSESVSDFLLLNSQSNSENLTETKDEAVKVVEVEAATPEKKKNLAHIPKLPTSFGVGKLLSNLQTTSGRASDYKRHSKSMNSLLDVPLSVDPKQQKFSSQIEVDTEETETIYAKSENILSKKASDVSSIVCKGPVVLEESKISVISDQTDCPPESKEIKVKITLPPQGACAGEDTQDQEILDDKKKDKKNKGKDSSRRKSGLAMLKQFFNSAKIVIRRKGETTDKDKLSINDTRGRKSNSSSAATSEKNSARTSLIMETDIQQEINCYEIPQQKHPIEVPKEKEVLESSSMFIFHRTDSKISESSIQSVQEEAFTATNAYKYEAKLIEIVEPDPFPSVQSDPTLSHSNTEEIDFDITPLQSSEDKFTNLLKSTRISVGSNVSLEKLILNKKSRNIPDVITKEDMEVAELRPSLPIKMKIKCPSPGYDVPRSSPIPIPCSETLQINSVDAIIDIRSCVVFENPMAKEVKQDNSINSSLQLKKKAQISDFTTLETESCTDNKMSHIIQNFNNESISISTTGLSKKDSLNKPSVEKRISFAQAETEMVYEEIVQILE